MATIQKRGDTYRVLIRKKGHKTVTRTFPKKFLAQQFAQHVESEMATASWREDSQCFGAMVDRYIKEIGPVREIGRSKMAVLLRLKEELGDVPLKDLTTQRLNSYAVSRDVSGATRMQDMIFIGVVLQTADSMWGAQPKLDEYKRSMVALKKLGVITESRERDRRVSDKEIETIIAHARTTFPFADLVWFSIHTSMRLGEVTRIRWNDLSEDGRTVIIRSRKHPTHKRDQRVPLLPEAVEIIQRQPKQSELIFPYKGDTVSTAFQRARDAAGLEDVRWHDLRHEAVSRLFERGLDMMTVAVFSGHRDINMLRRYTHLNAEKILDKLSAAEGTKQPSANPPAA